MGNKKRLPELDRDLRSEKSDSVSDRIERLLIQIIRELQAIRAQQESEKP
jgi:hypothetical protein